MSRGLELCGLHETVKQNQPLFVPGHFTKVSVVACICFVVMAFELCIIKGFFYPDADFLMMALTPILSEVAEGIKNCELLAGLHSKP